MKRTLPSPGTKWPTGSAALSCRARRVDTRGRPIGSSQETTRRTRNCTTNNRTSSEPGMRPIPDQILEKESECRDPVCHNKTPKTRTQNLKAAAGITLRRPSSAMGGKLSKKKKGYNVNDDKTKEAAEGGPAKDIKGESAAPADADDTAPAKEAPPAAAATQPEKEAKGEPAEEAPPTAAVKDEADAKKTEAPKAEEGPKAAETPKDGPKETPNSTAAPEAPPKDAGVDLSKDQSAAAQA
ncbi:brain acid soluble protein 1 homolog isoform X1 [Syngnathoides biaculeatus]|uniref:brain acid soluble protein 1 homolog isoform X1 n=2 Tax=Syngnathoides biaculeatus TaxID=300417 RepID=UPI002ADE888B|nr:brain acid soluble protein 1 homolog isoform X1 [Syngnathoides biaculeatus]